MHLVQILLSVADYEGRRFPSGQFAALRRELIDRFGGGAVFSRNPAEGFWQDDDGTSRDDIVVVEVMDEALDEGWWRERRKALEREVRQEVIVVRVQEVRLL